MKQTPEQNQIKNKRTALVLAGVVVGMFAFGFALVPLYDLLCQVTGIQSVSIRSERGPAVEVDHSGESKGRLVTVKFDTSVNPNLPWQLKMEKHQLKVEAGKMYQVNFYASNRSSAQIVGQAIPSIVPWQATPYFSKLECFCFNRQVLNGEQSAEMPLRFMVSPDLPKGIHSLTLSYSFMKIQNQDLVSQNQ